MESIEGAFDMNLEDYIKDLDPELQEKARACGSIEELLALAKDAKVPVPDEALAAIAGGDKPDPENCKPPKCPKCGSKDTTCYDERVISGQKVDFFRCNSCGYKWWQIVYE